ncbi:hypothetical protein R1sor_001427 [Riccia sorocarpa]|uniref:Uncharacterized protein n=1 Tax=Riccia sorocarpa TaxID=122646 RepID=A0ABD3GZ25_9MARC
MLPPAGNTSSAANCLSEEFVSVSMREATGIGSILLCVYLLVRFTTLYVICRTGNAEERVAGRNVKPLCLRIRGWASTVIRGRKADIDAVGNLCFDLGSPLEPMKLKVAWRNVVRYVRTDLKEIAFPSSLPDPPSSKPKPRKLTLHEHLQVWRTAWNLYVQSWKTGTIDDEELAGKKKKPIEEKSSEDLSAVEELALAARAGGDRLKPALQRLYMTRAAAYRDALKSFVEGYREGIAEVMASDPFKGSKGSRPGRENPSPDDAAESGSPDSREHYARSSAKEPSKEDNAKAS